MERQSVKSNFIYQVIFNLVTTVIPLIATPFLTRSLLEYELGRFSYTRSIASYFVTFSMLGIVKYGQRVISQSADDKDRLRKSFWSLLTVHIVFSVVALLVYVFVGTLVIKNNKDLFWIQSIYVLSSLFNITWVFYGLENFRIVAIRNTIIKIIEAALYILFIKSPSDIILYALINCSIVLVSQIVVIPAAIKRIKPVRVEWNECREHIKPLLVFAVAVIGIQLYTIFDTTLLGIFSSNENVAFYDYSDRIVKIPLTVASIIGTVLFPRACRLAAQNNVAEQRKYMNCSMIVVSLIGAASFWGLAVVGGPLATIYLGERFNNCGPYIFALAPLVFIVGVGDVVRTQFMIPNGMEKEYIRSIVINAVTNLVLSTALILILPRELHVYSAIIGTVAAETVGMIYQLALCRKFISINGLIKTAFCSFAIGGVMGLVIKVISLNIEWTLTSLIIIVVIGAGIFIGLSIGYIFLFEKDFKRLILRK